MLREGRCRNLGGEIARADLKDEWKPARGGVTGATGKRVRRPSRLEAHRNDRVIAGPEYGIPRLNRGAFIGLVRNDMVDSNLPNHVGWLSECFDALDSVTRTE